MADQDFPSCLKCLRGSNCDSRILLPVPKPSGHNFLFCGMVPLSFLLLLFYFNVFKLLEQNLQIIYSLLSYHPVSIGRYSRLIKQLITKYAKFINTLLLI